MWQLKSDFSDALFDHYRANASLDIRPIVTQIIGWNNWLHPYARHDTKPIEAQAMRLDHPSGCGCHSLHRAQAVIATVIRCDICDCDAWLSTKGLDASETDISISGRLRMT